MSRLLLNCVFVLLTSLLLPPAAFAGGGSQKAFVEVSSIGYPRDLPEFGEGGAYDYFGQALAIDGNLALVGVAGEDMPNRSGAGAVYVYQRIGNQWTRVGRISASDAASGDAFGSSVALAGNYAFIGAPGDDVASANNAGSVYVFFNSNGDWVELTRVSAPDAQADAGFGTELAFNNGNLLIAAPFMDLPGLSNAGAAYLFTGTGANWSHLISLNNTPGGAAGVDDFFGYSVAIDGDLIAIASAFDDTAAGAQAGSVSVFANLAGVWSPLTVLYAADGAAGDYFGHSVSVSGQNIAIGARWDNTPAGNDAGSTYVYVRSGNSVGLHSKLMAFDAAAGDYFGSAVLLDGDRLFVAAAYDDEQDTVNVGSLYLYRLQNNVWTIKNKLLAAGDEANDFLGSSIAVDGNQLLVGAASDDIEGVPDVGSVIAYSESFTDFFVQQQRLNLGAGAAGTGFGSTVAMAGDTLVVAAASENTESGLGAGAVYVFERDGANWQLVSRLLAPDAADGAYFGRSIDVDGDTLVVGAPGFPGSTGTHLGAVYVFTREAGVFGFHSKLTRPGITKDDDFGYAVAIDGDTVVIGARRDSTAQGVETGSAFVFQRTGNTWAEQAELGAAELDDSDWFGGKVAIQGDRILVGASYDEAGAATFAGAVYAYARSNGSWQAQGRLQSADIQAGDQFGSALGLDGDFAVIGCVGDDVLGNSAQGSAYVYFWNGNAWQQQQKLVANDGQIDDFFGISIAAEAGRVLISATGDDGPAGNNVGASYLFVRNGPLYSQVEKLSIPNAGPEQYAGFALALAGNFVALGVPGAAGAVSGDANVGAAYVFRNVLTVTPQAGAHGSLSPNIAQTVEYGQATAFTLSPEPGYSIAAVSGCGGALNGNVYTTAAITSACTVTASFVNQAPVIDAVANQTLQEDAPALLLPISIADTETPAAELGLSVQVSPPGLLQPPQISAGANGNQRMISLQGVADGNGGPVTVTITVADEHDASAQQTFTVHVGAINDAPNLSLGAHPQFAAGSTGAKSVAAFASFDAGPNDEDALQTVDDYLITGILGASDILVPGSVDISNNGTLNLQLTGVGGIAYVNVRVRDSGATGGAHQNESAIKQFSITVAPSADLQVAVDNARGGVLDGEQVLYTLVLANAGPNSISAAHLGTTHSNTLSNPVWSCNGAASTAACPSESSGAGEIDLTVELPAGEFLQFDILAEVDGAAGGFIQMQANGQITDGTATFNTANDQSSDQDPIQGIGVFSDGFETGGAQALSVPGAEQAMGWD